MPRISLFVAISLSLVGADADAVEYSRKAEFGIPGEVATFSDASFAYSTAPQGVLNQSCTAKLAPGLMYYVSENWAVGAALQSAYDFRASRGADYALGVVPKIAYQLHLNDALSMTPEISVGYLSSWQGATGVDAMLVKAPSISQISATLNVPLLIKPAPLRAGFAPSFHWDVQSTWTLGNNIGAGGFLNSSTRGEAELSWQSTLGIHF